MTTKHNILSTNKHMIYILSTYYETFFSVYSPDPYVTVRLLGTPNPIQKTKHVSKTCDPEWNETFQFFMDPKKDRVIGKLSYKVNFYM